MEKYATQKLREQINKFVEQQTYVPFTMHNIYQVLNMVNPDDGAADEHSVTRSIRPDLLFL